MKINNVSITSLSALNFDLAVTKPISILRGEHSSLALDLIREVTGDYNAKNDPNGVDDGRFIIHTDIEIEGKNYSVCYIRNADFIGDNRIAVNFKPDSIEFSKDDTMEFIEKCKEIGADNRPVFIYQDDSIENNGGISRLESLAATGRQVFVAQPLNAPVINHSSAENLIFE